MSATTPPDPWPLIQEIDQMYVESMYQLTKHLEALEEAKEQYRPDYVEGDIITCMQATMVEIMEKKIEEYRQVMGKIRLLRQEIFEEWKIQE